jgi:hypothetical protein
MQNYQARLTLNKGAWARKDDCDRFETNDKEHAWHIADTWNDKNSVSLARVYNVTKNTDKTDEDCIHGDF